MLNNSYFYFGITRKMVILFGSLFNNLIIQRLDANNDVTQIINTPLAYAQKEKMLTRVLSDPDINRPTAAILPRISFYLDGITYDNTRKVSMNNQFITSMIPNATYLYTATPYNFHFSLYIFVKNTTDACQLIEQILPFFCPSYTAKAFLIPGMESVEIPIILEDISHEDTDSTQFKDRSTLIWTLRFTAKASYYGPKFSYPLIRLANIAYYVGTPPVTNTANVHAFGLEYNIINTANAGTGLEDGYITYTPGLTISNTPTSNSAQSIPIESINWDDDWGIISEINKLGT